MSRREPSSTGGLMQEIDVPRTPDRLRAPRRRAITRARARPPGRPSRMEPAARRTLGRVHGRRVGRAGMRTLLRSARIVPYARVRALPGRVHPGSRPRAAPRPRTVVGLHPRARALPALPGDPSDVDTHRRNAGWAGSLPAKEVAERLERFIKRIEEPPERWVRDYIPAGPSGSPSHDRGADPAALRRGGRAHSPVRRGELHARIPDSTLVVMPGVGHQSNVEAADRFNDEVRSFLRSR